MTSTAVEPIVDDPSVSEALLLALDSSMPDTDTFNRLRDLAFRVARTRVIYASSKDDLVSVLQIGSKHTDNPLADQTPGGYIGVQIHMPLATASVSAVRAIAEMEHGGCDAHLHDLLDVAGDRFVHNAAKRARRHRLLIFTSSRSPLINDDDVEEFIGTCQLFRENNIQVGVILLCGDDSEEENDKMRDQIYSYDHSLEDNDEESESDGDDGESHNFKGPNPKTCFEKAKNLPCAKLLALSKTTAGDMLVYHDALSNADSPRPRSKRPSVKFTGVLDIAGILKIPVKRYTYTAEVKPSAGTQLSWEETKRTGQLVKVITDTNFVRAITDDQPLSLEDIIDAYHYGPNVVPVPNSETEQQPGDGADDSIKWSCHLERGLHVIGFVRQSSVPENLFMTSTDVVIPMKESEEAVRMLSALVLALHRDKLGILVRSVMPNRGGAPDLTYLWPQIESDRCTKAEKNYFFFATQLPMREDVKNLGFASIQDQIKDVSSSSFVAMEQFISASMLPDPDNTEDDRNEDQEENNEDEAHNIQILNTTKIANPNLHWFNLCILHRIINGSECTNVPAVPKWHSKLLDPISFLNEDALDKHQEAVQELKTSVPILPVRQRKKKTRRSHTAINANEASIGQFLPDENGGDGDGNDDNVTDVEPLSFNIDDDTDEEGMEEEYQRDARDERRESAVFQADADAISEMTDLQISDVGEETPVEDFQHLVRNGKFRFAALSLDVVIFRLIRDEADDEKAMRCVQVLRKACIEKNDHRLYNEFIRKLIKRCEQKDHGGIRTTMFFQYVGAKNKLKETLQMIPPNKPKRKEGEDADQDEQAEEALKNYERYLNRMFDKIKQLASGNKNGAHLPKTASSEITSPAMTD